MDQMAFTNEHSVDNFAAKLSPVTSAGNESQIDEQMSIYDEGEIIQHRHHYLSFNQNNKFYLNVKCQDICIITKQQLFQHIEDEIMGYFRRKGVEAGNPGDFKKQFNKKLHKNVSLMSQVVERVIRTANAGSSLLQRRLNKKMVVTL